MHFRLFRFPALITAACMGLTACNQAVRQLDDEPLSGPVDPFDYNYCGGVPVYPVIGVSFSTYCGPRNQVALGRYGTLMWLFPAEDGKSALSEGSRKLTAKELKHLSLLTEVAHLADPMPAAPGRVVYRMGINFPGRANKRLFTSMSDRYTPGNALFAAMLELVPEKPALPDCNVPNSMFDPNALPAERRAITVDEANDNQGYSNAVE